MEHRGPFYKHDIGYDRVIEIDVFSQRESKTLRSLDVLLAQIAEFD